MRKRIIFYALACPFLLLAQSSINNPPWKPQPRILIPHVNAPLVAVDQGGTITANAARDLKYCDFLLMGVDQGGTMSAVDGNGDPTPVVYIFSSMETMEHPAFDSDAVVYFQNGGLSSPLDLMRQQKLLADWESVYGRGDGWPTNITYVGSSNIAEVSFYQITDFENALYDICRVSNFDISSNSVTRSYRTDVFGGDFWIYSHTENAAWGAQWDGWVVMRRSTTLGLYPIERSVSFFDEFEGVGLSPFPETIMESSTNTASAIEVYPSLAGRASWLRADNVGIKWVCQLHNSDDFYRDSKTGEPVLFNCQVEWVGRLPLNGVWE